jgi:hypothetical protein
MNVVKKTLQNTSHAVMSQRHEPNDSLDNFPTPPWATRALAEYVLDKEQLAGLTCLEPACGAGHMAGVLAEYFTKVGSSDVYNYGHGQLRDYLASPYDAGSWDWIITNPPFRLAEQFVRQSLRVARRGVAILGRTVLLESVSRYRNLFRDRPPTRFAQFVERVPIVQGRLDERASTATGYAWFVWYKEDPSPAQLTWIPPCRKMLERAGDYPVSPSNPSDVRGQALVAEDPVTSPIVR